VENYRSFSSAEKSEGITLWNGHIDHLSPIEWDRYLRKVEINWNTEHMISAYDDGLVFGTRTN
jgi:hypothetical protein